MVRRVAGSSRQCLAVGTVDARSQPFSVCVLPRTADCALCLTNVGVGFALLATRGGVRKGGGLGLKLAGRNGTSFFQD